MRILAVALMLLCAAPVAAAELGVVTSVKDSLLQQFFFAEAAEVAPLIAAYTGRIQLGEIDAELATRLPYGADAVAYFAPNGDLLVWSDKSAKVESGYWELLDNGPYNELCIRFGKFGLDSVCASPQIAASDWLKELVEGNPFGLEGGRPVPAVLGPKTFTLSSVAVTLP